MASNKLRGRVFHQWNTKTKNLPQVYNERDRLNGLALLMVHRSIRISIKEIIDAFASTQQRRMKPAFLLDDATENSD